MLVRSNALIAAHTGTCGNELADYDVLFKSDKRIYLVLDSRFGEHSCRLLEGSRRKEAVGCKSGFRDAEKRVLTDGRTTVVFHCLAVRLVEYREIDHFARQQIGVPSVLDFDLFKHLTDYDFDVLVVYLHALATVDGLYFLEDIRLNVSSALRAKNVVRVYRSFGYRVACGDHCAVLYFGLELSAERYGISFLFAVVLLDYDVALSVLFDYAHFAAVLRDDCDALGLARLEQLLDTRQTSRNIVRRRDAARMEGTHRKLRARLAYGLSGYYTYRLAYADHAASRHILSVTFCADAVFRAASEHGSYLDCGNSRRRDLLRLFFGNHFVHSDDDALLVLRVDDVLRRHSARKSVLETFDDLIAFHDSRREHTLGSHALAAVVLTHDDVLRYVHETARKITGVGGLKRCVGKTFTSAVAGNEVLEHGKSLAEGGAYGCFERLTLGVGHKSAHTGKLGNLLHAAAGAGDCHHVYGVELVERLFERIRNFVVCAAPLADDELILLVLGHEAAFVQFFDIYDALFRLVENFFLFGRNVHIEDRSRDCADSRILEAERLYVVENLDGLGRAFKLESRVDDLLKSGLVYAEVDFLKEHIVLGFAAYKADILRYSFVEYEPADCGFDTLVLDYAVEVVRHTHPNLTLKFDFLVGICHFGFVHVAEDLALALRAGLIHSKIVTAYDHVLRRRADGTTVGKLQYVIGCEHQKARFALSFYGKRNVHSHLVAVEVGVERAAGKRMEFYCSALDKHGLERLYAEAVKCGRTVKEHGVFLDNALEHAPNLVARALYYALCALYVVGLVLCDKFFHDERLEQLERHFLGKSALIHLKFRSDDYNASTRIVDTLAEKVLPETSLLAAEKSRQRLELAVTRARNRLAASAVVYKRVDGLLKHTLFVSDDYVGSAELYERL